MAWHEVNTMDDLNPLWTNTKNKAPVMASQEKVKHVTYN